jgi:hypothetical protein
VAAPQGEFEMVAEALDVHDAECRVSPAGS